MLSIHQCFPDHVLDVRPRWGICPNPESRLSQLTRFESIRFAWGLAFGIGTLLSHETRSRGGIRAAGLVVIDQLDTSSKAGHFLFSPSLH